LKIGAGAEEAWLCELASRLYGKSRVQIEIAEIE